MKSTIPLQDRIYRAQCYGNVEPIEHMVPYPNLPALVEGQNIQYGDHLLYDDIKMTNAVFYQRVKQTANWLSEIDVKPSDRVLVEDIAFPHVEILAFGIWTMGASVVLIGDNDHNAAIRAIKPKIVLKGTASPYPDCINSFPSEFIPKAKSLLQDEALVFWHKGRGIRLSHYNLLVNANGVQRHLGLYAEEALLLALKSNSVAWVVLQAILPLFTGTRITTKNPGVVIGLPDQFDNPDYIINFDWINIESTDPPYLYILPEAGGILTIGESPIPLIALKQGHDGKLMIKGHSVMMGYLDDNENEKAFKDGYLIIDRVS